MSRRTASVYRSFFCVDDAKINCNLENVFCFRLVLKVIKDRERKWQRARPSNKEHIVFMLFSLTDEMALAVILPLLQLLWGVVKYYLGR